MVDIGRVRELYIASDVFNTFDTDNLKELNYMKWKNYIDISNLFVWFENTKDGQEILSKINIIPEDFKESFLSLFNYSSCYRDWNTKDNIYNVGVVFHKELRRITVSFEKKITVEDLKLFLEMANHLEALLLKDGKEIIDEEAIKTLE